jgi:hypothetical protein
MKDMRKLGYREKPLLDLVSWCSDNLSPDNLGLGIK